jgi:hypothetical protein
LSHKEQYRIGASPKEINDDADAAFLESSSVYHHGLAVLKLFFRANLSAVREDFVYRRSFPAH